MTYHLPKLRPSTGPTVGWYVEYGPRRWYFKDYADAAKLRDQLAV